VFPARKHVLISIKPHHCRPSAHVKLYQNVVTDIPGQHLVLQATDGTDQGTGKIVSSRVVVGVEPNGIYGMWITQQVLLYPILSFDLIPPTLSRCSKVYRGLGTMLLPSEFWVPQGDPAWCGGVERALMSTTADMAVAFHYANGKGTVVEIDVGRIQTGGDISFLSMVRRGGGWGEAVVSGLLGREWQVGAWL
jgi:hypothetical protein